MEIKKCKICKKEKLLKNFHKNKTGKLGVRPECNICRKIKGHEEYLRNIKNKKEFFKKYRKTEKGKNARKKEYLKFKRLSPLKYKANYLIHNAIRDKKYIKRNICEICYNSPTQCHHDDYNKPYKIIEFCKSCHQKYHNIYNSKKYMEN